MPAEGGLLPRRGGMAWGALAGLAGEGTGIAFAILTMALLARHLGPADFGAFGLAMAAAAAVGWSLASLFSRAALFFVATAADPPATAGRLMRSCVAWGLGSWAVFAVAGVPLGELLGQPVLLAAFLVAGSEVLMLPLSRLYRGVLSATGDYAAPGLGAGVFHSVRLAAVGLLLLAGGGPVAALLAIAAARSVEIAFYWIRLPLPLAGEGAGGILHQMAGPTLLQAVSLQVFFRVDILLLGVMGAAVGAIGWYAAAQQLAVIAPLVAGVVAPMATVALARGAGSKDIATLDRRTDHITCAGLILFIASAGVAPLLAPILFGPEFAPAAPLFAWLALGGAGTWLSAMGSGRWAAAGQVRWPAAVSLAALLVAVPAHVLSIPAFGALGAAIVTATTGALAGLVTHLSAPGRSSRRVLETLAALGLGAIAAVAAHSGLSDALSWLGWPA